MNIPKTKAELLLHNAKQDIEVADKRFERALKSMQESVAVMLSHMERRATSSGVPTLTWIGGYVNDARDALRMRELASERLSVLEQTIAVPLPVAQKLCAMLREYDGYQDAHWEPDTTDAELAWVYP